VLHESEDLYSLLEAHEGRALALYVYNSDSDTCRQLTLTPNSSWGGQGRYKNSYIFNDMVIKSENFSVLVVELPLDTCIGFPSEGDTLHLSHLRNRPRKILTLRLLFHLFNLLFKISL
jgi:hypothetical protein